MKRNKFFLAKTILLTAIFAAAAQADFELVDKKCAMVESELPILLSEVNKFAADNKVSQAEAQQQLIGKRALKLYARRLLKFSSADQNKMVEDHIAKLIKTNNLTEQSFARMLMGAPYFTSVTRFKEEVEQSIIEGQIKGQLASQVKVSEDELERAKADHLSAQKTQYDLAFISVNRKYYNTLTPEQQTLKDIKENILTINSFAAVNRHYEGDGNITILGPLAYVKGSLKKEYEDLLAEHKDEAITAPLVTASGVEMIWKIPKAPLTSLSETTIENIRNGLYEKKIEEQIDTIKRSELARATVELSCNW